MYMIYILIWKLNSNNNILWIKKKAYHQKTQWKTPIDWQSSRNGRTCAASGGWCIYILFLSIAPQGKIFGGIIPEFTSNVKWIWLYAAQRLLRPKFIYSVYLFFLHLPRRGEIWRGLYLDYFLKVKNPPASLGVFL